MESGDREALRVFSFSFVSQSGPVLCLSPPQSRRCTGGRRTTLRPSDQAQDGKQFTAVRAVDLCGTGDDSRGREHSPLLDPDSLTLAQV